MTADASNPQSAVHDPKPPLRSPAALSRFFLTAVIGIVVDLWTKVWAFGTLVIGTPIAAPDGRLQFESVEHAYLPGWLHFKVTANYGAVFGVGQGMRFLFLGVSLAAIVYLVYLFAVSRRQRFYQFVLGMLLAGVIGNMYDRLRFGYVRDMIYALPHQQWFGTWQIPLVDYPGPGRYVFPWIFNVADSLLCVGVGLMLIYALFFAPREDQPEGEKTAAASGAV